MNADWNQSMNEVNKTRVLSIAVLSIMCAMGASLDGRFGKSCRYRDASHGRAVGECRAIGRCG